MAAMQALGPEMKKLQQKYKGPENRAQLNEEMMKLYKEHKVNPASGCLPMLLQMPFFFMLYSVIRGITNTVGKGSPLPYTFTTPARWTPTVTSTCQVSVCADPRYISRHLEDVPAHRHIPRETAVRRYQLRGEAPLPPRVSPWMYIPYALLVLGAVGLQYLQMSRLNARNPQANQANPQAAMLQKYMPLIFGFIYLNVAAILNVYFIVSSAIRIGTQEVLFRRGIVPGPGCTGPRGPDLEAADACRQVEGRSGDRDDRAATPEAKGTGGSAKSPVRPRAPAGSGSNGSEPPSTNGSSAKVPTTGRGVRERGRRSSIPGPRPKKRERRARHVEWVEASGKSLAEAKETVLDMLGVAEDDAEFVVLSEPKAGPVRSTRGEARVQARVRPVAPPPKRGRRPRPEQEA